MKAYAFVYSRTKYDNTGDYRILTNVSESIVPMEVIMDFERSILSLTSAKDFELQVPQWLFIKKNGISLWGMAGANSILNNKYGTDDKKRFLRNFTGIIIPNYLGQKLPGDMAFFSDVFSSVMEELYESFVKSRVKDVLVDASSASSFISKNPEDGRVNTDYHKCRVFSPTVDAESLVASCLSYPDDISIAINVARIESVTTPRFNPLMNAVMRDPVSEEITDIPVKHLCNNCGKVVDDLYDGLCQECWDAQHPHCSRCGKETSDLRDGLCDNCYDKEHPRCAHCGMESHYLQDGLCPECWDKDNIYCTKCGRKMAFHTKQDVCEECARKKRVRMVLYYVILVLSILILFVVKKCKQEPVFYEPKEPIPERIIPEIPKNTRHASEIMQSREVIYEQNLEQPAETNEMMEEEMQEQRNEVGAEPDGLEYR